MNWQTIEKEIETLAQKCESSIDVIVGVVRGGLVPARLLAKFLGVKEMYCLTVAKQDSDRVVTTRITADLAGKSVLLVEDALESGRSLIVAKGYLESLGAEVQTAALYIQPQTQIMPDYYVDRVDQIPMFPWE